MNYIRGIGLVAASVLVITISSNGDERKPAVEAQKYWDCAKACDDCARLCTACATHCANKVADGKKEHVHTLQSCQDCASICTAAGKVTARLGPYSHQVCMTCADICKSCAMACDHHRDDVIMKKCADECRNCEKACRTLAAQLGHAGN